MHKRTIACNKYNKSVGSFGFKELCDAFVSSADFIALAQNIPTILLEDVEQLSIMNRNVMRRFINLVINTCLIN
jgi:predicted ATPase